MPKKRSLNIVQSVFIGYSLTVLCLLIPLGQSLWQLYAHNQEVQRLSTATYSEALAATELERILNHQKRLGAQYELTGEASLLELQYQRRSEYEKTLEVLKPYQKKIAASKGYQSSIDLSLSLLQDGDLPNWRSLQKEVGLYRQQLLQQALSLQETLDKKIRTTAEELDLKNSERLRTSLLWALIGLVGGLTITIPVFWHIPQAMTELVQRTRRFAQGDFAHDGEQPKLEEFTRLESALKEMGDELAELHKHQLDANPLTHLPGNQAIQRELDDRLATGTPFAFVYIDLDDFKAYNDRYGYQSGSTVIAETAILLRQSLQKLELEEAFVGHIGGDDYVAILGSARAEELAAELTWGFDQRAPFFYSEADRKAGGITSQDRYGVERRFTLMTISIAVIFSDAMAGISPDEISRACARIKHELKRLPGSHYRSNR